MNDKIDKIPLDKVWRIAVFKSFAKKNFAKKGKNCKIRKGFSAKVSPIKVNNTRLSNLIMSFHQRAYCFLTPYYTKKILKFKQLLTVKHLLTQNQYTPNPFKIVFLTDKIWKCRSSRSQMSFKTGLPENFAIFTGKVACLKFCSFIKKRPQHRCFSVNIANFLRTPFFTVFSSN